VGSGATGRTAEVEAALKNHVAPLLSADITTGMIADFGKPKAD